MPPLCPARGDVALAVRLLPLGLVLGVTPAPLHLPRPTRADMGRVLQVLHPLVFAARLKFLFGPRVRIAYRLSRVASLPLFHRPRYPKKLDIHVCGTIKSDPGLINITLTTLNFVWIPWSHSKVSRWSHLDHETSS